MCLNLQKSCPELCHSHPFSALLPTRPLRRRNGGKVSLQKICQDNAMNQLSLCLNPLPPHTRPTQSEPMKANQYSGTDKWKNTVVTIVAWVAAVLGALTVVAMFCIKSNTNDKLWPQLLLAFWAIVPAIWFWVEYHVVWRGASSANRVRLEEFAQSQETSRNLWLALVAVLLALFFSGGDQQVAGQASKLRPICLQHEANVGHPRSSLSVGELRQLNRWSVAPVATSLPGLHLLLPDCYSITSGFA